jgi:hypothetical protein
MTLHVSVCWLAIKVGLGMSAPPYECVQGAIATIHRQLNLWKHESMVLDVRDWHLCLCEGGTGTVAESIN